MTLSELLNLDDEDDLLRIVPYFINKEKTLVDTDAFSEKGFFDPDYLKQTPDETAIPQDNLTSQDSHSLRNDHTSRDGLTSQDDLAPQNDLAPRGDYARMFLTDEKTGAEIPLYVTSHYCQPDHVVDSFMAAAACASYMQGRDLTKPLAYQFVQSFEDDPDLSDEEVHQIGLEFGERAFHEYPFLMASHVHPITDKKGLRGKRKHNHFLICAYKAPEFCLDSRAVKLNSDHALLDNLRVLNDRLAIDHGLTIVRDPDIHRSRSWHEEKEKEARRSWKEQTREDITVVRDQVDSWPKFKEKMEEIQYTVREAADTIYITPENHKVSAAHLGREYTKTFLDTYWLIMKDFEDLMQDLVQASTPPPLRTLMDYHGPLYVNIPVGIPKKGNRQFHPLRLDRIRHKKEVLESYFDPLRWYSVKNARGDVVAEITGHYILDYLEAIRRDELPVWATTAPPSPHAKKVADDYWYVGPHFQNDPEKRRYRVCWYNIDGSRRPLLEVAFRCMVVAILGDQILQHEKERPEAPLVLTSKESSLQPMLDVWRIMRDEGVSTVDQLEVLLYAAEKEYEPWTVMSDSTHRVLFTAEEEAAFLCRKKELKEHINRLRYAVKYGRMTPDEVAEAYTPKEVQVVMPPQPPMPDFFKTKPPLDNQIRSASRRVRTFSQKDHHTPYHER